MTITFCGQLVTSTKNHKDLKDWVKAHNYPSSTLAGRKIWICPKKLIPTLAENGAVELPRPVFTASAFWAESKRTMRLLENNDANLEPAEVRVRDVTQDGLIVIVHPNYKGGSTTVEVEYLEPV